jgi:hypothetical protein
VENKNIFEYLNEKSEYKNRIVADTLWSIFLYILKTGRKLIYLCLVVIIHFLTLKLTVPLDGL